MHYRFWVVGLSLVAMLALTGCPGDATPDDGGSVDAAPVDAGLSCPPSQSACGSSCVMTANDPQHCGGCDMACNAGEVCSEGSCALACGGGTMTCGDRCVDLATDEAHCGRCDLVCPNRQICVSSTCSLSCAGVPCTAGQHVQTLYWSPTDIRIYDVDVDSTDNVIISGAFRGTQNFGGEDLEQGSNAWAGFLAKFDSDSNHVWSFTYGGGDGGPVGGGSRIDIDSHDNIVIAGAFRDGSVIFPGGTARRAETGQGWDSFIASVGPDGSHRWSHLVGAGIESPGTISTGPNGNQNVRDVVIDSTDAIIVTGSTRGTVNFGIGGTNLTAAGTDIMLVKYSSDGDHLWGGIYGDDEIQEGLSVAIDGDDNVVFVGQLRGVASLGTGFSATIGSRGNRNAYVAKLNSSGTHLWNNSYGVDPTSESIATQVRIDRVNNIYVGGRTRPGPLNLGGDELTGAGSWDGFMAKLGASGSHIWSIIAGDGEDNQPMNAFELDPLGNPFVVGHFAGSLSLDSNLDSQGAQDLSVIRVDGSTGEYVWSQSFGDGADDRGTSLALDGSGRLIVVGIAQGNITFGDGRYSHPDGARIRYGAFVTWLAP